MSDPTTAPNDPYPVPTMYDVGLSGLVGIPVRITFNGELQRTALGWNLTKQMLRRMRRDRDGFIQCSMYGVLEEVVHGDLQIVWDFGMSDADKQGYLAILNKPVTVNREEWPNGYRVLKGVQEHPTPKAET